MRSFAPHRIGTRRSRRSAICSLVGSIALLIAVAWLGVAPTWAQSSGPDPATWIDCGAEGGVCALPNGERRQVLYGADDNFEIFEVSGAGAVNCANGLLGDPKPYTAKRCWFSKKPVFEPQPSTWQNPYAEGAWMTLQTPHLVRFGINGSWSYQVASGYVQCGIGDEDQLSFQYDPAPDVPKVCQVGQAIDVESTQVLAGESGSFDLSAYPNAVLVRYGNFQDPNAPNEGAAQWVYRWMKGGHFTCSPTTFGQDPYPNRLKQCQLVVTPTVISHPSGRWEEILDCGDCTGTYSLEYGTTNSTTESRSNSWTRSVQDSISAGFNFEEGGSASDTVTVSNSHTTASSMSSTLSTSFSSTCSAQCDGQLYRWRMAFEESCTGPGSCPVEALSCNFICVEDGGGPPTVPLGCCNDPATCREWDSTCRPSHPLPTKGPDGQPRTWTHCGSSESGFCTLPDTARRLVLQGFEGRYAFAEVEGMERVPCGPSLAGDPAAEHGAEGLQHCWYANEVESGANDGAWWHARYEGETFNLGPEIRRLRYGNHGKWVYRLVRGFVDCSDGPLGEGQVSDWDPNPDGTSACQLADEIPMSTFVHCGDEWQGSAGSEHGECVPDTAEPTLYRYGHPDVGDPSDQGKERHIYRYRAGDIFSCSNESFGLDPYFGVQKRCEKAQ